MASNANFEIPTEMRAFAERSMEEARKAFDTFVSAAHRAVTQAESQATSAQTGAKDVGELAIRFAEKNILSSFDFAQRLVQAHDMEEVMRLQTDYVKMQMQTLADQAKELSQTAQKFAGSAAPRH
ncbi:MAG TPA: phasin family protein [Pseudolabrys sp.]|nr:phasin family protein [Pseudolabrys sp.]